MKLFLDDRRECPPGWALVRNIEAFRAVVRMQTLEAVSFDHDLEIAHYGGDYSDGRTGYDALKYLIDTYFNLGRELPRIELHTASPAGKARMRALLDTFINASSGL